MFHAEAIRVKYSLYNLSDLTIFSSGPLAVEFFFVLSGFLITYLLLAEYSDTGTINIKHFYMRRILRIWPLYYLILIIGLLLIPIAINVLHIDYTFHYPISIAGPLFTFFLPNLVLAIWGSSYLGPLWSIDVEEQFYFFWAPLIKRFKKYPITIFWVIIVLRVIFYFYYIHLSNYGLSRPTNVAFHFINILKFEAMSIGALGAWLFYSYRQKLLSSKLFSIGFQVFALAVISLRLIFHNTLIVNTGWGGTIYSALFNSFYSPVITNFLFLWLILNISSNPKSLINTDNKVFNLLGNISYGIYMYHGIVLLITVILLKNVLRPLSPIMSTTLLYAVAAGLTILAAYLTYRFIELKFLAMKKTFEHGNSIREKNQKKSVVQA
jgi:peptidoglycan/LPS O-acetylase OafA/YrhL